MRSYLSSTLMWRGVLALVIGLVSVIWPSITIGAFVILFAVYAFLAAGTELYNAFRGGGGAGRVAWYVVLAVLSLAAGLIALLWPSITVLVMVLWLAGWALVTGVVEVVMAFGHGESGAERVLFALSGLISVFFGVVLIVHPGIGAVTLAVVFGLFAIMYGVADLVLAAQVRRGLDDHPGRHANVGPA